MSRYTENTVLKFTYFLNLCRLIVKENGSFRYLILLYSFKLLDIMKNFYRVLKLRFQSSNSSR